MRWIKHRRLVFLPAPDYRPSEGRDYENTDTVALSMLAGAALGAAAIQGLHAQAKPPAYVVAEIDVTNQDGFVKEFAPQAVKALGQGAGYKAIARGGKTVAIEGAPPLARRRTDAMGRSVAFGAKPT